MIQTNPEHEDLTKLGEGAHSTETRVGNLPQPQPGTTPTWSNCGPTNSPAFAPKPANRTLPRSSSDTYPTKRSSNRNPSSSIYGLIGTRESSTNTSPTCCSTTWSTRLPPNGVGSRSISTPGAELASKCWPNTEPRRNHPRP